MDKYEEIAADIIDTVEERIRSIHPQIEKIGAEYRPPDLEDDEDNPNTLLHGENYYNLEYDIAETLREAFKHKRK